MIIYLDESKQLGKWKIVIWWFITYHNTPFINSYIDKKKRLYWFNNIDIELKSIKSTWKIFYEKMSKDGDFQIISNNIIWVNIEWYYKDSLNNYIESLSALIWKIYDWILNYNKDITIIADRLTLWKNTRKVELEIQKILNERFPLKNKHKFNFANSKSFWWIQLADLISYQLRKVNILWDDNFDDFILDNTFNINFKEVIKI